MKNITYQQQELLSSLANESPVVHVGNVYKDLRHQAEVNISNANGEREEILNAVKTLYTEFGSGAVESLHAAVSALAGCGTGLTTDGNLTKDPTPYFSRAEVEEFGDHVYCLNKIGDALLKIMDSLDRIGLYEEHTKLAKNHVLL